MPRRRVTKPLPTPLAIALLAVAVIVIAAGIVVEVVFPYNPQAAALGREINRIDYAKVSNVSAVYIRPGRELQDANGGANRSEDVVQWAGDVTTGVVKQLRVKGYTCTMAPAGKPLVATCTYQSANYRFRALVTKYAASAPLGETDPNGGTHTVLRVASTTR